MDEWMIDFINEQMDAWVNELMNVYINVNLDFD